MIRETINELIELTIKNCLPWLKMGEDGLMRFVDPIDGEEITAHYGATHFAAALILYGEEKKDSSLAEQGYNLLDSVLQRWKKSKNLPGFHNDFNNFAMCVIWNYFHKKNVQSERANLIRKVVLDTPDSNHPTVNWIPMRWYVNLIKYSWTEDDKYKTICDKCRANIKSATYKDGFIDDRIPIGVSFNLQYDVATVAAMQFLRCVDVDIDLSYELGALLNAVAPDGDINYLGRGTNQIFAWGLWVYLLASSGKTKQVGRAVDYLKVRLPAMLMNNNMMLNEWPGEEKYMWWDYHYCSVYTAHLLFWLIIADMQWNQYPIEEQLSTAQDSGVKIYRDTDYFVVTFDGRKEYLAEKGPCIAALWTKSEGMVIKGTFGPWQGAFGNQHSPIESTIRNNCGLYKVEQNKDYSQNRYLHKLMPSLEAPACEKLVPLFENVKVVVQDGDIVITWTNKTTDKVMMSIPSLSNVNFTAMVDGKNQQVINTAMIRNQYSWVHIYQTKLMNGSIFELRIRR